MDESHELPGGIAHAVPTMDGDGRESGEYDAPTGIEVLETDRRRRRRRARTGSARIIAVGEGDLPTPPHGRSLGLSPGRHLGALAPTPAAILPDDPNTTINHERQGSTSLLPRPLPNRSKHGGRESRSPKSDGGEITMSEDRRDHVRLSTSTKPAESSRKSSHSDEFACEPNQTAEEVRQGPAAGVARKLGSWNRRRVWVPAVICSEEDTNRAITDERRRGDKERQRREDEVKRAIIELQNPKCPRYKPFPYCHDQAKHGNKPDCAFIFQGPAMSVHLLP